MGVDNLWSDGLGNFRKEPLSSMISLAGKTIAIDVSAWVHQLDQLHDTAYARTAVPPFPSLAVKMSFKAKHRALKELHITPIYVFDGKQPSNMKKNENERRGSKSAAAKVKYNDFLHNLKSRPQLDSGEIVVSEQERQLLWEYRREMSRPTVQDYASLCEWMNEVGAEYIQAPFEADAQMKQLVVEKRAQGAITEDGDLIVYQMPNVYSKTTIDTNKPESSKCQHFSLHKLQTGAYASRIKGRRLRYLPEISCLMGNDYIKRWKFNGPIKVLGKNDGDQCLIDELINHIVGGGRMKDWLLKFEELHSHNRPEGCAHGNWSDRFIYSCNLIRYYPVFKRDLSGNVSLEPLNPLPVGCSRDEWHRLINFDKKPDEYFSGDASEYYSMSIVGSTDQHRSAHLGPHYSDGENIEVDGAELLPIFGRLSFEAVPVDLQPISLLKYFLLHRGIETTERESADEVRRLARRAAEENRPVLPPSLTLEPVAWVAFEALDEDEMGDEYDNWSKGYFDKLRSLKFIDDDYIDRHYGTKHAQTVRERALRLLKSGNIDLKSIKVRNVKSDLRTAGEHLLAIQFNCLGSSRGVLHNVYVVMENKDDGEYVRSPCSYCSCEDGAFFCSHVLCFLFFARLVQGTELSKEEFESVFPENPAITQACPVLIQNIIAMDKINRQKGQSSRKRSA
mmetsp:Transcript_2100/g.3218  ORF Transcript_2100/g.3218 Transcript_2100/m.3218 type:complete len:677 (-) Transcript_2100:130-2160(-)